MTLKTNDCNDLGQEANSACMGLNLGATPPDGVASYVLTLNKDRGVTAPMSATTWIKWADPQIVAPFCGYGEEC